MIEGVLIHALVCFEVTLVSFWLAMKMFVKHDPGDQRYLISISFGLFWMLFGISYLCISLYLLSAAYYGADWASATFLYCGFSSFALITAPLAFFIVQILIGNRKISLPASLAFMMIGLIYIILLFRYGVEVSDPGYWSVNFRMHHLLVLMFVYAIYIPAVAMIMALIPFIALKTTPALTKYKIAMSLISLSIVYGFTLLAILHLGDLDGLLFDIMILIGTLVAYVGYFPPECLVEWFRLKDPAIPEFENQQDWGCDEL